MFHLFRFSAPAVGQMGWIRHTQKHTIAHNRPTFKSISPFPKCSVCKSIIEWNWLNGLGWFVCVSESLSVLFNSRVSTKWRNNMLFMVFGYTEYFFFHRQLHYTMQSCASRSGWVNQSKPPEFILIYKKPVPIHTIWCVFFVVFEYPMQTPTIDCGYQWTTNLSLSLSLPCQCNQEASNINSRFGFI